MAKNSLKHQSPYAKKCIILTTKHAKSIAIGPPFFEKLKASILEHVADTDLFGTFSGEIKRSGSALECAQKKCELSFNHVGSSVEYALASEGSFGPHPSFPFMPCNQEILYFIDRRNDFHLHMSHLSQQTNYRKELIRSIKDLLNFAKTADFPSHGLILHARGKENEPLTFKDINSFLELEKIFYECIKYGTNKEVRVETDMRAHYNPSRMAVIKILAEKMASRLATNCPNCDTPGWGKTHHESGLPCTLCNSKTKITLHEIFGCTKCSYIEKKEPCHGLKYAAPETCEFCNP